MRGFRHAVTASCLIAALVAGSGGVALHSASAAGSFSLSFAIYKGNCFTVNGEPAYKLDKLVRKSGTQIRALPAYSDSTVNASLQALQGKPYSLVVTRKGDLKGMVACGEINNAPLADGTVAVGLREQAGSLYAGVALLNAAGNGNRTQVRAYVSAGLSEGQSLDDEATDEGVSVDTAVTVSVDDQEITADQVTFKVGTTAEFDVTNNGTSPHEVMIEPQGGNEEPLESDDGTQAETEDIAVGETSTFVYTFDKAGTFQLADHIGDDSMVLEITVEQ